MKIRRAHALLTLALLASCSDGTGPADLVATLVVSPDSPVTDVGLGVQFSAQARDAEGAVVSGVVPTWRSSQDGVASISTDGLASARAVGTTTISATVGGASDSAVLRVEPPKCTAPITVQLAAGEHQAFAAAECLRLPAGAQDRYRIALIRPTQIEDEADTATATLRVDPVAVVAEAATPTAASADASADGVHTAVSAETGGQGQDQDQDRLPRIDGRHALEALAIERRTLRYHVELRRRERDLGLGSVRPLPTRPQPAAPMAADPPSSTDFRLSLDCEDPTSSPATLVSFNDELAIYQDTGERATTPISAAAATRMLDYYSQYVADMSNQYWGRTPDIDGNGRVLVTTAPELADSVAAAVFSGDLVSTAECASSNEAELIYFSADVIRRMDGGDPRWSALGTLAHEAKHVTSLYHSVARDQPRFHPLWIEEGTAEIATEMSSRIAWAATGGPPLGTAITGDHVRQAVAAHQQGGGPGGWPPEIDGVIGNLAGLIVHLSTHPNSLITNPEGADSLHTFYAAGWHMSRFIGDAWGEAASPRADSALFRALTDSTGPAGSAAGLTQLTGRTFEQLFEDLAVAMSLHEVPDVAPPTRPFTTYDLVSATDIFSGPPALVPTGVYPWPLTSSEQSPSAGFTSATFSERVGPSSVQLYDFVSDGGVDVQVQVTGAQGARLVVTRLH